jgi:hypothetical protein
MRQKRGFQEWHFPIFDKGNILFYEGSLFLFCGRMEDFIDKI